MSADFTKAYNRTALIEGGYANDPDDKGGETWKGIARNSHPNWEGWAIVDLQKSNIKFPEKPEQKDIDKMDAILSVIEKLEFSVKKFFKSEFWDKVRGDELKLQAVANSLYDSAVNFGPRQAIKLAQRALKANESGVMDDVTLKLLNNG